MNRAIQAHFLKKKQNYKFNLKAAEEQNFKKYLYEVHWNKSVWRTSYF